jgi:hypothetical protein
VAAQANLGPDQTASEWLEAIRAQAPDWVWRLMDSEFRLVMAQRWITHNEEVLEHPTVSGLDRDTFARELSSEDPTHPLWPHCARVTLREITQACGGLENEDLAPGSRPRPIAPELELVRLFRVQDLDRDETGQYFFAPGAQAMALTVIVRHGESGWLVAGIGEYLYQPGWPPQSERVAQPED